MHTRNIIYRTHENLPNNCCIRTETAGLAWLKKLLTAHLVMHCSVTSVARVLIHFAHILWIGLGGLCVNILVFVFVTKHLGEIIFSPLRLVLLLSGNTNKLYSNCRQQCRKNLDIMNQGNKDIFHIWPFPILTLWDFDSFHLCIVYFWHCNIIALLDSDTFRLWHYPIKTVS